MTPRARRTRGRRPRLVRAGGLVVALALVAAACGDDGDGAREGSGDAGGTRTVRLITHDSFAVSDEVLAELERTRGIEVELVSGGDAGTLVNQAVLTKDDPLADVLFGVDTTFLSRALDEDIFEPYESPELAQVDPALVVDPRVTPIDVGDVCVNYDRASFGEDGTPPPTTLDDLADPDYRGELVVQNPATSSPGLAFLLATVARYGEDGWQDYWRRLRANDVLVTSGWEEAYNAEFSAGPGAGERALVVSYASSPPADVVFSDPPRDTPEIGVVTDTCFRQVEYAGILAGTERRAEAEQLIDFMLSRPFQEDVPLQMFVFPVRRDAELPEVFREFAVVPEEPLTVDPGEIGANRERWIDEWTTTVLG